MAKGSGKLMRAALRFLRDGKPGIPHQPGRTPRDIGRARRIPAQAIGVFGKAVIIVQQGLTVADMDGDVPLFPMAGDEQDRLRPLRQRIDQPGEIGLHRAPHRVGRAAGRIHEEAGAAAMRDEECGKGHVRHIGAARRRCNRACGVDRSSMGYCRISYFSMMSASTSR